MSQTRISEDWQDKTCVVCGASAGLGRNFALEFAARGVRELVLLGRSQPRLDSLREDLLKSQPQLQLLCLPTDICHREQLQATARQLSERETCIDYLVQCVGKSDRGQIMSVNAAHLQDLLIANVQSSLNALQYLGPLLTRPGGRVVLIGSLASKFAPRYLGGYAIAKHALAALAQQARLELADEGIHVTFACPGPIARPDAGHRYDDLADGVPEAARKPGGGARLKGLEPQRLVQDILRAAAAKQPELIRPRKARWLHILSAISPRLGDRLLRHRSS